MPIRWATNAVVATVLLAGAATMVLAPESRADEAGYLINVTWMDAWWRPGYNFAGPDDALRYGYGICDRVSDGHDYAQLINEVRGDFNIPDDFHATYLISNAVDELCPAMIWHLRNSAAHYRPPPGVVP